MQKKKSFIPYGKQDIQQEDKKNILEVLNSDYLTQGPKIRELEEALSSYCQVKYASLVSSGTAALHLACLALNIGKNDIVWTSSNSFVASANCILYTGAKVDFIDISKRSYNICSKILEEKLLLAKQKKRLPKAIIAVHFAGQSCNMERLKELSQKYNFFIIEDASHAIGGKYKGKPIGNCHYSDLAIFSFHPVKIITTGEGGVLLTKHKNLHKKIQVLRTHGITKDSDEFDDQEQGIWYYEQKYLGFNYRITDIQCALGLSQLKRLSPYVKKRTYLAKRYNKLLEKLPIILPFQVPYSNSSYHLYPIKINPQLTKKTRRQLFDYLRDHKIGVQVHYIPIHLQPYYKKLGFKEGDLPNTEAYYKDVLSIPLFPKMREEEQDYIIDKITSFFNE